MQNVYAQVFLNYLGINFGLQAKICSSLHLPTGLHLCDPRPGPQHTHAAAFRACLLCCPTTIQQH